MKAIESNMWEILVPHRMGKHDKYREDKTLPKSNKVIHLDYHRNWDAKVRAITGGLTICKAINGQWVDTTTGKTYKEIMIPVRIACTEEQIKEIAEMTMKYYFQKAIFVSLVSEKTFIFS